MSVFNAVAALCPPATIDVGMMMAGLTVALGMRVLLIAAAQDLRASLPGPCRLGSPWLPWLLLLDGGHVVAMWLVFGSHLPESYRYALGTGADYGARAARWAAMTQALALFFLFSGSTPVVAMGILVGLLSLPLMAISLFALFRARKRLRQLGAAFDAEA